MWALKLKFSFNVTPGSFVFSVFINFSPNNSKFMLRFLCFVCLISSSCVFFAFSFILHLEHHNSKSDSVFANLY